MASVEGLITLKADTAQVRKATTDLSNFNKGAVNASTSAQNLGNNVINAQSKFKAARGATSQLSFQLQDIAVQAQSGTSAFTILAQQGPQIASVFGPGGAVVGAFIAVGAALAGVAFNMKTVRMSSAELELAIKGLEKEFNQLTAAQQEFIRRQTEFAIREEQARLDQLRERYSKLKNVLNPLAAAYGLNAEKIEEQKNKETELLIQMELSEQKINDLRKAIDGESESIDDLIEGLEQEAALIGLSNRERDLEIAKRASASALQREQIELLYDEIEAKEAAAKKEEELRLKREIDDELAAKRFQAREEAMTRIFEEERRKRQEREEELARLGTQRMLEASEMLLAGKSEHAQQAAQLAINLADAEKRENAKQIISDSYAAAMKAYKSLSGIPVIGPALGAAAAGAIIAAGVSYSAKSLTGRALGGQVRPGESYVVGERGPEVLTMGNAGGRIATNESMRGAQPSLVYSPTVNISGGATEQDRALFTAQLRQQKAEIADLLARRRF